MSEGCGAVSANVIERNSWKSGTSGKALEGIEVMLQEPNDKGEGEVMMYMYMYTYTYMFVHTCMCICMYNVHVDH